MFIGGSVVVPNEVLEILRRFGGMVERDLREEVVYDMEVSDIVEKETALPSQKVVIDSCSGATLEVPGAFAIVRELGVGMLEVGDHNEPLSNSNPRQTVKFDEFRGTEDIGSMSDAGSHKENTSV